VKSLDSEQILVLAHDVGFHKSKLISVQTLYEILTQQNNPALWQELSHIITSSFKTSFVPVSDCSLLICALSCYRDEEDDPSTADDPHVLIAPFARRNYYREAVQKMKKIACFIRECTGFPKQALRIFCNSRIPEKLLAALSGMGFYGKNSLLISPGLGSRFVIAILLLPFRAGSPKLHQPLSAPGKKCGDCTACITACPTGALLTPGKVDLTLCLQHLSTELTILPEEMKKKWGFRLYGCESCQDVCPYNQGLSQSTITDYGNIGSGISIKTLLRFTLQEWKDYFNDTPMGLSWINPYTLIRNTLLAAGNRKNKTLKPSLEPYTKHENIVVRDAALWATETIVSNI
jgi:epoxyqueuosine reductase